MHGNKPLDGGLKVIDGGLKKSLTLSMDVLLSQNKKNSTS